MRGFTQKIVLFYLIGGLGFFCVHGLDQQKAVTQYKLDTWSLDDGFPLHVVYAIQQTGDGFLWLGTRDGLVRFDGIRFEVYNQTNTPWLKSNKVSALFCDNRGQLWIGTGESGLYCLKGDVFVKYPLEQYPTLKWINDLAGDQHGNLWIGTSRSGLSRLREGILTTYTTKQGLLSDRVTSLLPQGKKGLLVGSPRGVAAMVPGPNNSYRSKPLYTFKWVHMAYEKKNGEAWFSATDGLYKFDASQSVHSQSVHTPFPSHLPDLKIVCAYEDRDLNFWLGSEGNGLIRFKEGEYEIFSLAQGLRCPDVYSIFEDREGSLWIGTIEGGLHRLRDSPFTVYTKQEGLKDDAVRSIYQDGRGDILIGTGKGLNRLKNGTITSDFQGINKVPEGVVEGVVNDVLEDRSGVFWIAGRQGLARIKNGKLSKYTTRNGLSYNEVNVLLEDRRGRLWIGTNSGLNRFSQNKFIRYNTAEGLAHHSITWLHEDRDGNLWIGTINGLSKYRDGAFLNYSDQNGLPHNYIESITEDKDGVLYIATRGGLSRLKKGTFFNYTSHHGLVTSRVNLVLEDDQNCLWLAGPGGICRLEKKQLNDLSEGKITTLTPRTYDEQDGLKTRWCDNSGLKSRDGKLWFATSKGAVMIDPAKIKENPIPPPVIMGQLTLDGRETAINGHKVVIPAETQRLEIRYTATTFIKPEKVKFKIKLKGYDRDWLDMDSVRITNYTDLPPGEYTFQVIAANSDGVWNQKGASLEIYKKPFWYQTLWAYLLFIIVLVISMVLFVKWRSWKLIRETRRLEGIVRERTVEVQEKNVQLLKQSEELQEMDKIKSRFFANISHEFRTPLTLIMGPLEQMLSGDKDREKQRAIAMALRNSRRLLSLINQLLDLSKLDSGKLTLDASKQDIVPLLQGLTGSFESLLELRRLNLHFQCDEKKILLFFDTEKLEKAVINLIANAIKFTPDSGNIGVKLVRHPQGGEGFPHGWAEIIVSDTGPGISKDQLPYIFDRFYQAEGDQPSHHKQKGSGIGLALTSELIALHRGDIRVESTEGSGSAFTIRLPLPEPDELDPSPVAKAAPDAQHISLIRAELDEPGVAAIDEVEDGEPETAEESGNGKNVILVVDDNPDVRSYIRGPLLEHYQVVEAVDGQDGIERAMKIIPDLIISDVMMPRKDGFQLCQALKTDVKTSHIPIILLTAKASEESVLEGLETGADDYVTKPFNARILLTRIKNLIALRRQLQENIQRELLLQPAEVTVSSVDREFMEDLKMAIDKNISDIDFGVDQLAASLYLSRATLNRKLRAVTGQSTNQFIQSYRLKRAAQLLKANFGNVTEVTFEVGFSNAAYFTKCFKEQFNCLPSEYHE